VRFGGESAAAVSEWSEGCGGMAICAFAAREGNGFAVQRICGERELLRSSGRGEEMAPGYECSRQFESFLSVGIFT
jgi:hypothetical protein